MGGVDKHIDLALEIKKKRIHPVLIEVVSMKCPDGIYDPSVELDFLDIIEIIMELETRSGLSIPDDDVEECFDGMGSKIISEVILCIKKFKLWKEIIERI